MRWLAISLVALASPALAQTVPPPFTTQGAVPTITQWSNAWAGKHDAPVSGILSVINGTAPQALRVYNTYTDASNGEWGALDWQTTANVLTIGSQKNGTGTARPVIITAGGTQVIDMGYTFPSYTRFVSALYLANPAINGAAVIDFPTGIATGGVAGVSCAAGTVTAATMVVTKGIVTHC